MQNYAEIIVKYGFRICHPICTMMMTAPRMHTLTNFPADEIYYKPRTLWWNDVKTVILDKAKVCVAFTCLKVIPLKEAAERIPIQFCKGAEKDHHFRVTFGVFSESGGISCVCACVRRHPTGDTLASASRNAQEKNWNNTSGYRDLLSLIIPVS